MIQRLLAVTCAVLSFSAIAGGDFLSGDADFLRAFKNGEVEVKRASADYFSGEAIALLDGNADRTKAFVKRMLLDFPENAVPTGLVWVVLGVDRYLARSGDLETVEYLRPGVECLVRVLQKYRNSDGLLERPPAQAFHAGGERADRTCDVDFRQNMLWAEMLDAADRLYGCPYLAMDAESVREAIRKKAWNGRWFVDGAMRGADGRLSPAAGVSETCQSQALYFGVATPERHPGFADRLLGRHELAPAADAVGKWTFARLLARHGRGADILRAANRDEAIDPLVLLRGVLGVSVNPPQRLVEVYETDVSGVTCEWTLPVGTDKIVIRRTSTETKVDVPAGWHLLRRGQKRADWMAGRYGLMVHYLYPHYDEKADCVNAPVDSFRTDEFLRGFDASGADWLIFTIGQGEGAYASPNAVIEAKAGPGHCSKRDLVQELATAVHARGKRFIAYLPTDHCNPQIARSMGWDENDPLHAAFQTNWTAVIREWAVRFGPNLDGWWFDGSYPATYPCGWDYELWGRAARAGNPRAAVSTNPSIIRSITPTSRTFGLTPSTPDEDYLAGEINLIKDGRVLCNWDSRARDVTWLPESGLVPGTECRHHVLFCIDGFWTAWDAWYDGFGQTDLYRRHPDYFDEEKMSARRKAGEFVAPIFEKEEFLRFAKNFMRAGGGVTVNVGVAEDGRLNPHSLEYLNALRQDRSLK